jgi:hypothetical protein
LIWRAFPEISTERLAVHNGKKVIKAALMKKLLRRDSGTALNDREQYA